MMVTWQQGGGMLNSTWENGKSGNGMRINACEQWRQYECYIQ